MNDFIELITKYDSMEIIIIVLLTFSVLVNVAQGLFKGIKSIKDWNEKFFNDRTGREKKAESIKDRISRLERHDNQKKASMEEQENNSAKRYDMLQKALEEANQKRQEIEDKQDRYRKETDRKFANLQKSIDDEKIDNMRDKILDFGTICVDYDKYISKEKYNNIFKKYSKYEELLKYYNKENGETEATMEAIRESFKIRLENKGFLEDLQYKK